MAAEITAGHGTEKRATTAGREFIRRFSNLLCELRLQPGIHQRIERLLEAFAEEHPNVRASYLARTVDENLFQRRLVRLGGGGASQIAGDCH